MATKILVHGDVEGEFDALFTRVSKVHGSKAGPFDVLLCVGTFFGRKGAAQLDDYVQGRKQVPLPTYFICGDEFDTSLIDALPSGGAICPNLHYLGRAGVQNLSLGAHQLTVAYLSGHYDPSSYFGGGTSGGTRHVKYQPHYVEEDVIGVMGAGLAAPHVDVLLTTEWAKGWQMLLPAEKMPASLASAPPQGSPVVAKLAAQIPARYHFAGTQDAHFELPAYHNKHFVTRFIGVAKLQNQRKEKSLCAFNVKPFATLDRTTLPADATPCPYTAGSKPPPAAASSASGPMHPFPSDASSNKRQRLDGGAGAPGPGPDGRFAPGFMNSMQQYDAASAMSNGAMRWDMSKPQRGPPPSHYICRRCNEPGHWIEDCPTRPPRREGGDRDQPPDGYICRKCNQPGHLIRMCPLVIAENEARAAGGPRGQRSQPPADYVCAKCSQPGHWIQQCPLVLADQQIVKPVPEDYVCKVCKIPGHWLKDCEIVKRENAERAAQRSGGGSAGPPLLSGVGLDAAGLPSGTSSDCWFCLATEHVSTHLILSVGSENYLALAKGGLTDDHSLILPIVHVSNSLEMTTEQRAEMERYKLALRRYFRSQGQECVMYERFIPTRAAQHMHIQVVPVSREQARTARQTLLAEAAKLDARLTFALIPREHTLAQANPSRQPFVLFELPVVDDADAAGASSSAGAAGDSFPVERLIHFVQPRQKVFGVFDFPRTAVAHMIARPERADWKACSASEAEETELVEKMKETFGPFDFTMEAEQTEAETADSTDAAAAAAAPPATEAATPAAAPAAV